MRRKGYILALIIFAITSCCYDEEEHNYVEALESKIDELEDEISVLNEEYDMKIEELISEKKEELEIKENETYILNGSTKELELVTNEGQLKFLDFYKEFSTQILYNGHVDNGVKVEVQLVEPLRILPSEDAPYVEYYGGLTYDNYYTDSNIVTGDLLYVACDRDTPSDKGNFTEWCYVCLDGSIVGYVKEEMVISYDHESLVFEEIEQFQDFSVGMTVDEAVSLFENRYRENYANNYPDKLFSIVTQDNVELGVNFICSATSRIVTGIIVSTEEYPLMSGYKVGDDFDDFSQYYDEFFGSDSIILQQDVDERIYELGGGYFMQVFGREGKVKSIVIDKTYIW